MSLGRVIADTILSVSGQAASRNDTLETLTPMSTKLDDMTHYFRPLLECYKFISFIETKQTKLKRTGILGRALTRVRCYFYLVSYLFGDGSNVEQFVVDRESATLGQCTAREVQVPLKRTILRFVNFRETPTVHTAEPQIGLRQRFASQSNPGNALCLHPTGTSDYLPRP